jgi:hypothetical protein
MVASHFEAGDAIDRETIITAFLHRYVEDREGVHTEQGRSRRLKPTQYLPLGYRQGRQFRDKFCPPGAGTDNQFISAVASTVGAHLHPLTLGFPTQDALLAVHFRSQLLCHHDVGDDTALREQKPAIGLIDCHDALRQAIARKTRIELVMIEDLMGQMVDVTGSFGACKDLPIRGRGIDRAGDDEQALLDRIFQLSPELIGPSEQ